MTTLLQQTFEKVAALPDVLQNEIAQQWLEELEWELAWDDTLAHSQETLNQMALHALNEYRSGKTVEKGFDEV